MLSLQSVLAGVKEILTPKVLKMKVVEFGNSVDPDEVALNEPPHLDLHCLLSGF